jgi:hypothetical protein
LLQRFSVKREHDFVHVNNNDVNTRIQEIKKLYLSPIEEIHNIATTVSHASETRIHIMYINKKLNLGICIAPTQPFRAALGAESNVLPPLAVNSKSERKVNSLPPLEFELVIIGMLAHLSNHSTKSHPIYAIYQ